MFFFSSRRRHTRCSRDWSSDVCSSDLTDMLAVLGEGHPDGAHPKAKHELFECTVEAITGVCTTVPEARADLRDRKSTRLNSSHGYISYAVFCLKKKKKNKKTKVRSSTS